MLNVEIGDTDRRQGLGHFGAKFGEEVVDPRMLNFKAIWKMHGAIVCKRNHVDIFCRLSTMHERDRQTDRQTDHARNGDIDRNRRKRLSSTSPNNTATLHRERNNTEDDNIWLRGVMSQYHRVHGQHATLILPKRCYTRCGLCCLQIRLSVVTIRRSVKTSAMWL